MSTKNLLYCLVVIVIKLSLVYISLICLYLWPLPTMFRIINIQYYLVFICADGKDGNTTLYPGATRFQWFYGFLPLKYMCIIAWRYSMLILALVLVAGLEFRHY